MANNIPCPHCELNFSRPDNRNRHIARVHNHIRDVYICLICKKTFNNVQTFKRHKQNAHRNIVGFEDSESALKGAIATYRYVFHDISTIDRAKQDVRQSLFNLLQRTQNQMNNFKVGLTIMCEYVKGNNTEGAGVEGDDILTVPHHVERKSIERATDLNDYIDSAFTRFNSMVDTFISHGSNWLLNECLFLLVDVCESAPLAGACSNLSIINNRFENPSCKVRITNDFFYDFEKYDWSNDSCFFLTIAYHFTKSFNPIILLDFIKRNIKLDKFKVPFAIKDIERFENTNTHLSIMIHVLINEGGDVFPLYVSKQKKAKEKIILLLSETINTRYNEQKIERHYSYITDLNKFLRPKRNKPYFYNKVYCINCFAHFTSQKLLDIHFESCQQNETQVVINVPYDKNMVFDNFQKCQQTALVGFFDFETLQENVKTKDRCSCRNKRQRECPHQTFKIIRQVAFCYTLLFLDQENEVVFKKTYHGIDAAENFVETLTDIEGMLLEKLVGYNNIQMTDNDNFHFYTNDICLYCEKNISPIKGHVKVRDHDHRTGRYRGVAHHTCNLQVKKETFIPIYAHNFSGFDSHLVVKALNKTGKKQNLTAIALNTEKFKTIKFNSYKFLDSAAFLPSSLDRLINDLCLSNHDFPLIKKIITEKTSNPQKCLNLLLRKGVYCYE